MPRTARKAMVSGACDATNRSSRSWDSTAPQQGPVANCRYQEIHKCPGLLDNLRADSSAPWPPRDPGPTATVRGLKKKGRRGYSSVGPGAPASGSLDRESLRLGRWLVPRRVRSRRGRRRRPQRCRRGCCRSRAGLGNVTAGTGLGTGGVVGAVGFGAGATGGFNGGATGGFNGGATGGFNGGATGGASAPGWSSVAGRGGGHRWRWRGGGHRWRRSR